MKVQMKSLGLKEWQQLLSHDPLRNLKVRQEIESWSREQFQQDCLRRADVARFDPRIAESLVERFVLFPHKIDLNFWIDARTVWPRALLALALWARHLSSHSTISTHSTLDALLAVLNRHKHTEKHITLEAFYIDLYSPSSERTREAVLKNPKIWESCGYWAHEAPYSKELLQFVQKSAHPVPPVVSTTKRIDVVLHEYARRNKGRYFKLEQLVSELGWTLSSRQLLRHLRRIEGFKQSGERKGARYRFI